MLVPSKKKQVKVLLVAVNNEAEPYPVAPIGVAYVGQSLSQRGFDVRVLDLCFIQDELELLNFTIKDFCPDIVGISIRNIDNLTYCKSVFYLPRIHKIVSSIKKISNSPIIAGGSGFSIFPEETLRYLGIVYGVIGEGEHAFPELINAIMRGGAFEAIPNICYIHNDQYNMTCPKTAPFNCRPDRGLILNSTYLQLGGMGNIQSKRGCPFSCTYCTYPNIEGKRLRLRDPEDIVDELAEMRNKYSITHAFFVDDIFNYPEDHAFEICEGIIKKDLKIGWTCFATPKDMTRELALVMKRAGCRGLEFGTDAATETTLKGLGKNFSQDEIAWATECCNSVDLPNAHYIIIGGPGESSSTVRETLDFFDRICPSAVIALIGVRVYPNTLLHKRAILDGVVSADTNLLEPVFYLSPEIQDAFCRNEVLYVAETQKNWVVPGLAACADSDKINTLRKMGIRGPLWDLLPNKSKRRL